jgi:outer membrane protein assembly factor BamB
MTLPECSVSKDCTQAHASCTHAASNQCFDVNGAKSRWSILVGKDSSDKERLLSNIVVYNNVVFGGTVCGRVFAVDASTHKILWSVDVARKVEDVAKIGGIAVSFEGDIVVTLASGDVLLLDGKNGEVKKKVNLSCSLRSSPTIVNKIILIQSSTNALFALDSELNTMWEKYECPEDMVFLGNASPTYSEDLVFAAYSTGEYRAYDINTGAEVWFDYMTSQFQDDIVGNLLHVYASQVVSDGMVFTLGHGGRLSANYVTSGDRVWSATFSGMHTPAVIGEWVYVTDETACVYCIHKRTGKVRWRAVLPSNSDAMRDPVSWTSPLIAGGTVLFVTEYGDVVFYDASDGHIVRKISTAIRTPATAVIVEKTLYVMSNQGILYAIG